MLAYEFTETLTHLLSLPGPLANAAHYATAYAYPDLYIQGKLPLNPSQTLIAGRRCFEMISRSMPLWGDESFPWAEKLTPQEVEEKCRKRRRVVGFCEKNLLGNWRELKELERQKDLDYTTVGRLRRHEVRLDLLTEAFRRFEDGSRQQENAAEGNGEGSSDENQEEEVEQQGIEEQEAEAEHQETCCASDSGTPEREWEWHCEQVLEQGQDWLRLRLRPRLAKIVDQCIMEEMVRIHGEAIFGDVDGEAEDEEDEWEDIDDDADELEEEKEEENEE